MHNLCPHHLRLAEKRQSLRRCSYQSALCGTTAGQEAVWESLDKPWRPERGLVSDRGIGKETALQQPSCLEQHTDIRYSRKRTFGHRYTSVCNTYIVCFNDRSGSERRNQTGRDERKKICSGRTTAVEARKRECHMPGAGTRSLRHSLYDPRKEFGAGYTGKMAAPITQALQDQATLSGSGCTFPTRSECTKESSGTPQTGLPTKMTKYICSQSDIPYHSALRGLTLRREAVQKSAEKPWLSECGVLSECRHYLRLAQSRGPCSSAEYADAATAPHRQLRSMDLDPFACQRRSPREQTLPLQEGMRAQVCLQERKQSPSVHLHLHPHPFRAGVLQGWFDMRKSEQQMTLQLLDRLSSRKNRQFLSAMLRPRLATGFASPIRPQHSGLWFPPNSAGRHHLCSNGSGCTSIAKTSDRSTRMSRSGHPWPMVHCRHTLVPLAADQQIGKDVQVRSGQRHVHRQLLWSVRARWSSVSEHQSSVDHPISSFPSGDPSVAIRALLCKKRTPHSFRTLPAHTSGYAGTPRGSLSDCHSPQEHTPVLINWIQQPDPDSSIRPLLWMQIRDQNVPVHTHAQRPCLGARKSQRYLMYTFCLLTPEVVPLLFFFPSLSCLRSQHMVSTSSKKRFQYYGNTSARSAASASAHTHARSPSSSSVSLIPSTVSRPIAAQPADA